jgi:hypothetical protein
MRPKGDVTMPVALVAGLPIFLFRLGFVFVRLKLRRRRGVRRFRRTLVRGGMDPDVAELLVAEYESYGRLRAYLPAGLRFRPFPFRP